MTTKKDKTKKYMVSGAVTISVFTEVEARSPEEAQDLAMDQPMMTFCYQCSTGRPKEEWVTSGELDGDVTEIRVEEA